MPTVYSSLIPNAGFDDWTGNIPDHWTVLTSSSSGGVRFSFLSFTGLYALEMQGSVSVTSEDVPVIAGADYDFRADIYTPTVGGMVSPVVEWGRMSGQPTISAVHFTITPGQWQGLYSVVTAPPDAITARVRLTPIHGLVTRWDNAGLDYPSAAANKAALTPSLLTNNAMPAGSAIGYYPTAWGGGATASSDPPKPRRRCAAFSRISAFHCPGDAAGDSDYCHKHERLALRDGIITAVSYTCTACWVEDSDPPRHITGSTHPTGERGWGEDEFVESIQPNIRCVICGAGVTLLSHEWETI